MGGSCFPVACFRIAFLGRFPVPSAGCWEMLTIIPWSSLSICSERDQSPGKKQSGVEKLNVRGHWCRSGIQLTIWFNPFILYWVPKKGKDFPTHRNWKTRGSESFSVGSTTNPDKPPSIFGFYHSSLLTGNPHLTHRHLAGLLEAKLR